MPSYALDKSLISPYNHIIPQLSAIFHNLREGPIVLTLGSVRKKMLVMLAHHTICLKNDMENKLSTIDLKKKTKILILNQGARGPQERSKGVSR